MSMRHRGDAYRTKTTAMTGVGSLPAEGSKKKTASEDAAFSAGEGTQTHTHEAPDPKSGLSTNFNTPATEYKDIKKCKKTKGPEPTVPDP